MSGVVSEGDPVTFVRLPKGPFAGAPLSLVADAAREWAGNFARRADAEWGSGWSAALDVAMAGASRVVVTPAMVSGPVRIWRRGDSLEVTTDRQPLSFSVSIGRVPGATLAAGTWLVADVLVEALVESLGGVNAVALGPGVGTILEREINRRTELDELRDQDRTSFDVALKLPLKDLQRVAVEFVVAAGGRAYLADKMGRGKTPTAIGVVEHYRSIEGACRTLCVVPAGARAGWAKEIQRFTGSVACVWTASGPHGSQGARYHVVNYDVVDRWLQPLLATGFELLILDEAHRLSNPATVEARAILGDRLGHEGIRTPRVLALSGTPTLLGPLDAFPVLNFIDPRRFPSAAHLQRAVDGWGSDVDENCDRMRSAAKAVMIRRTKAPDGVPSKVFHEAVIDLRADERALYDARLVSVRRTFGSTSRPNAVAAQQLTLALQDAKYRKAVQMVRAFVDAGEQVIFFSQFHRPLEMMAEAFTSRGSAVIHGGCSQRVKKLAEARFQSGQARVICCATKAAGVNLNLTAARREIFLDQLWVPALMDQAADRGPRLGSLHAQVDIYTLVVRDTIDGYLAHALDLRGAMTDRLTDDVRATRDRSRSVFDDVMSALLS